VAQGIGPEFKPQYCKNKTQNLSDSKFWEAPLLFTSWLFYVPHVMCTRHPRARAVCTQSPTVFLILSNSTTPKTPNSDRGLGRWPEVFEFPRWPWVTLAGNQRLLADLPTFPLAQLPNRKGDSNSQWSWTPETLLNNSLDTRRNFCFTELRGRRWKQRKSI
jgi:hypothetical protein